MNGSRQADEPKVQFLEPRTNERHGIKHKRLMGGHKFMKGRRLNRTKVLALKETLKHEKTLFYEKLSQ